jgi:hypothetical protein
MFTWILGKRFAAPKGPLRDHWVTANVRLHAPLPVEGAGRPAAGYFRILGLRCTPLRLRSFVEEIVYDGLVLWPKTEWHEVNLNRLNRSLRNEIDVRSQECVWHLSGCIFFPEKDAASVAG